MALQPLHGPVEEAADGLVLVLLVGGLDDQGDGAVQGPGLHGSRESELCRAST